MDLVNRLSAPRVYRLALFDTTSPGSTRDPRTDTICDVMGLLASPSTAGTRTVRVLTVADLHQRRSLYTELQQAVVEHRPDAVILCGDFLHSLEPEDGMLSVADCAADIARLDVAQVIAVRGNHENHQFIHFADALSSTSREMAFLHGEAENIGPLTVLGFECLLGDEMAFALTKHALPPTPGGWVPRLARKLGAAARSLWCMHEPPAGTSLSAQVGPLAGNPEWRDLISRFSPRLVICGHDHDTPIKRRRWHDRIGETLIVNVGQTSCKRLHFSVMDADFCTANSPLPYRITVRAFPWHEEVTLGPAGPTPPSVPAQEPDR